MPIIRKRLRPSDVYPDDIRYNETTETVQSFIDGSWVDNPQADPRNLTTFPPRSTANPRCDAAQSVVDALQGQIDGIIVAIDNASTAFTIAGLILSLLSFGVFAIFISIALFIADQMIAAGSTALEAALTPSVYDTLKCILFCSMDAQGRLEDGSLPTVQSKVDSQIGGLGAVILNQMLALAGEGGINNLASLGTSTGNCSACDCIVPIIWWVQADQQSAGTVTNIGFNTYRVTSGVGQFQGTNYSACRFTVAGQVACFRVTSMTFVNEPECLNRRYRFLCGGGEGFGDFVALGTSIIAGSTDRFACTPKVLSFTVDITVEWA